MTSLQLDENHAAYQIRSYKAGFLRINESTYTQSLIITPKQIITDWRPQMITELEAYDLQIIRELHPDVLLLGTGEQMVLLTPELYGDLVNNQIGVEVMDTSAACRTFNALAAENRSVAAALIIK